MATQEEIDAHNRTQQEIAKNMSGLGIPYTPLPAPPLDKPEPPVKKEPAPQSAPVVEAPVVKKEDAIQVEIIPKKKSAKKEKISDTQISESEAAPTQVKKDGKSYYEIPENIFLEIVESINRSTDSDLRDSFNKTYSEGWFKSTIEFAKPYKVTNEIRVGVKKITIDVPNPVKENKITGTQLEDYAKCLHREITTTPRYWRNNAVESSEVERHLKICSSAYRYKIEEGVIIITDNTTGESVKTDKINIV